MSSAVPPSNDPGFNVYADQRDRIIGTMVSIYVITTTFVALRFLSRKLSNAGFWVRSYLYNDKKKNVSFSADYCDKF